MGEDRQDQQMLSFCMGRIMNSLSAYGYGVGHKQGRVIVQFSNGDEVTLTGTYRSAVQPDGSIDFREEKHLPADKIHEQTGAALAHLKAEGIVPAMTADEVLELTRDGAALAQEQPNG